MNTVTFNDSLLLAAPFMEGAGLKGFISHVKDSPIIDWSQSDGDGFDASLALDSIGFPRLPFHAFRASLNLAVAGGGEIKCRAWLESYAGINERQVYDVGLEILSCTIPGRAPMKGTGDIMFGFIDYEPDGKVNARGCVFRKGSKKFTKLGGVADYWMHYFYQWVVQLANDYQNPHLHLVKKSQPNPGGKSVKWQKAREHYVLIHKSHPANKKEPSTRRLVIDGDTINRSAHSRRAHYRMLSSPVFRHKMGQRVWVRSSWCGPKEWTDRSGQIYQIVDRN